MTTAYTTMCAALTKLPAHEQFLQEAAAGMREAQARRIRKQVFNRPWTRAALWQQEERV